MKAFTIVILYTLVLTIYAKEDKEEAAKVSKLGIEFPESFYFQTVTTSKFGLPAMATFRVDSRLNIFSMSELYFDLNYDSNVIHSVAYDFDKNFTTDYLMVENGASTCTIGQLGKYSQLGVYVE